MAWEWQCIMIFNPDQYALHVFKFILNVAKIVNGRDLFMLKTSLITQEIQFGSTDLPIQLFHEKLQKLYVNC